MKERPAGNVEEDAIERAERTDDPVVLRSLVKDLCHRVEELREEVEDEVEEGEKLFWMLAAVEDRMEKLVEPRDSAALGLAKAITDFAEWQEGRYGTHDKHTRSVIGRALWHEVEDRVADITCSPRPSNPGPVLQRD